jgi:two-component system, NtrC family, response regulator HydG
VIGRSLAIRRAIRLIERAAPTRAPVIITGESGTGKERAARAIHDLSPRSQRRFVAVNSAALPETLIESELFGHERGAFTGADRRRDGWFEQASGGTIFLDEFTEMPLAMQPKLLRVLEDGSFRRLGGSSEIRADVRIVAATNGSLPEAIRCGRLRADLFYRLNVFVIRLPPLRDRTGDIALLTEHFIDEYRREYGKNVTGADREFLEALEAHAWPGNVRELRNVIHRAVALSNRRTLSARDLPRELAWRRGPASSFVVRLGSSGEEVERELLLRTVAYTNGNKARAANIIGVSRGTLYNRLRRYHRAEQNRRRIADSRNERNGFS